MRTVGHGPSSPTKVLVYHRMARAYRQMLLERFPDLCVVAAEREAELAEHLPDTELLVAFRFPVDMLARAAKLRWIQLTSAGIDHVLAAPHHVPDVVVTNARGIHVALMADYTMGAIVMLQWNFPRVWWKQQAREWSPQSTEPLAGRTLGVVGLGAIGREIARRGAAFGMRVVGMRREAAAVPRVSRLFLPHELAGMLPLCDFLVLVVPATAATHRMVGERELRAMKPTAYLINVARGSVVDEAALVRALREGWIAGAALDVFETEPLAPTSPLWGMDNVIVTPHIAGEPEEYLRRVMEILGDNIARWRAGRPLRNLVDLERGY